MYCDFCGSEVKEGASYCRNCGVKINPSAVDKIEEVNKNWFIEFDEVKIPMEAFVSNEGIDEYYFERGDEEYDNGNFHEAIEYYSKVIELNPTNYKAYYNRGYSKSNLGKFDEGLIDIKKSTEINPNYARGYCGKGEVLLALKKLEEAVGCFSKSIQIDHNFQKPYILRAKCCLVGNFREGLIDMEHAKKLGDMKGEDYLIWGELFRLSGNKVEAKEKLQLAIQLGDIRAQNISNNLK